MRNEQGVVLVISYLTVTFLIALAAVGFQRSATELRVAERHIDSLQALHMAEGGVDDAHRWMRNQPAPPAGTARFDPFNGDQPMPRGRFRATIDPDDNNPTRYIDLFSIEATGEVNGVTVTRRVTKVLSTESFARYSYFTNSELLPPSTPIWFTSRDHLAGPVHSNDRFNIAGSPVFDGPVTSAADSINYRSPPPTGGNNPQFNGGLTLAAAAVQLPQNVTPLRVAASSGGGAWYTGNTTITLRSDGTMLVTNPAMGWVNRSQSLPLNGAIFVNGGNVTVSGTLDGQLSIGASHDIIVSGNLRYADDPRVNAQSNDILGLVAERNVVIARTAPADVELQASIMALNSSFTVEQWWQGPPKGTLSVYGGMIQKSRGPVGTFSSSTGQKVSGYSKDYRYDSRFSSLAPPFYPTTDVYRQILWRENP